VWRTTGIVKLTQSRDRHVVFVAAPEEFAIVQFQPQRVLRVAWASRPGRIDKGVVEQLLDVVDDPLSEVVWISVKCQSVVDGDLNCHMAVRTHRRPDVSLKALGNVCFSGI
jgi:hypothetical protein